MAQVCHSTNAEDNPLGPKDKVKIIWYVEGKLDLIPQERKARTGGTLIESLYFLVKGQE